MDLEFKNGSCIKTINSDTGTKRSKLSKNIQFYQNSPSAFAENILDIKLSPFQKKIVDNFNKVDQTILMPFRSGRQQYCLWQSLCQAIFLDEDAKICLVEKVGEPRELNKEEYIRWLCKKLGLEELNENLL